jgi:hypothetical protein
MNDKKFVISNLPENLAIPSEEKEKPNSRSPGIAFRMGLPGDKGPLSNEELDAQSKAAMQELSKMFNTSQDELNEVLGKINNSIQELGISKLLEEGKDISSEAAEKITNDFINELEKLSNKNNRSNDIDNFTVLNDTNEDEINEKLNLEDYSDDDIFGSEEVDLHENIGYKYEIVNTPNSFGMVECENNPNIYEKFKEIYGDKDYYDVNIFVPKVDGYNLIDGLSRVKKLEYLFHNNKYMLLKAIPSISEEPFVIALIYNDHEFELVIPEYGNTYDLETGELFDVILDANLYHLVNGEAILKNPLNLAKIRAGLDLVLYEKKKPILSISNFGKVINSPSVHPERADLMKLGRIKANDSSVAKLFKRDFDFDPNQDVFDFYVKLPYEYPASVLAPLGRYLLNIDFNTNKKMQSLELKAVSGSNGYIYVELDLGEFPDYINLWSKE